MARWPAVLPSAVMALVLMALALAAAGAKAAVALVLILYAGQKPMRAWFHLVARQPCGKDAAGCRAEQFEVGAGDHVDDDRAVGAFPAEKIAHFGEKIELLAELLVFGAVGNITTCGDIAVVDRHAIFQPRGDMARMAKAGKVALTRINDGQF